MELILLAGLLVCALAGALMFFYLWLEQRRLRASYSFNRTQRPSLSSLPIGEESDLKITVQSARRRESTATSTTTTNSLVHAQIQTEEEDEREKEIQVVPDGQGDQNAKPAPAAASPYGWTVVEVHGYDQEGGGDQQVMEKIQEVELDSDDDDPALPLQLN